jgi:photosystem II stability/assembly factor-like uncharacterized protein
MSKRRIVAIFAVFAVVGGVSTFGLTRSESAAGQRPSAGHRLWAAQGLTGTALLKGDVPLQVVHRKASFVRPHPASARMSVSFGFPLRDKAGINALIAREARTHVYLTRAQLYAKFSPPRAQVAALRRWLRSQGLKVTHEGRDRLLVTASGTTAQVERALHVKIDDYVSAPYSYQAIKVKPYVFYANTTSPTIPARFGLQTVSGLSDIDRFFTQVQLDRAAAKAARAAGSVVPIQVGAPGTCGSEDDGSGDGGTQCTDTRAGSGYYPSDLRSMYDVSGHGFDGTGQTLGFTLWGAGETQRAMNAFSQDTGDPLITVDTPCVASGNDPGTPSSCTTQSVAGNHLLNILENGNTNNNYGGNVETALDIEQAHGIASGAGMKYYLADCTTAPPPGSGLSNGGNCNGSDVGMEEAIEDAANDPTLHSVSNSWAFGGEPEWGTTDPFFLASQNSLALAAAAGTTFYFSTGDSGTYQSGYPSDSQYVVGVGGTTLFSTQALPAGTTANTTRTGVPGTGTAALSTEDTWAAGGSWCSNIVARPAWQDIPAVSNAAPCPGRVIPDVSAMADTNSAVLFVSSTATGFQTGGVGGTSVAAPEMNGLEAVTENFIAAQSYPGATPAIGFEAPTIYKLGSENSNAYFRDVLCGNTASPSGGPDGDAAQPGWDPATGWGAPDWYHFAIGYAQALGATGLTTPASDSQGYGWTCARTPSNATERGISFPSSSVGYAVGTASNAPWPSKFLASGAWGATNTFFKTTDGGLTWVPSNSDMLSIACTSASSCVEVGDGGVIKATSDGGTTWSAVHSPTDKALTSVSCPSSSVCYSAGDRGIVLKSTDGGQTWSYLHSTDGNPIYGLTCTDASTCYATDIYAHIVKTSDGGATWQWQTTPVTTPGLSVPGSGGPNPFAGLFGVSCVDANDCVAVGGFPPAGTDPPIVATTNGGTNWTLETSNAGTGHYLNGVACVPGSTTCYAVGRGGAIVVTTDMLTWSAMASNTTSSLSGIECSSTASCIATGQGGTIDVLSGGVWTPSTGNGGGNYLAGISCPGSTTCYVAGKQGVTLGTTDLASWTQQAGGGTTQQMNSISCVSTSTCYAVGNAGTILATTNGGQTWLPAASGTTSNLSGVSCTSATSCAAVGAVSSGAAVVRFTSDGSTWQPGTSGTANALNGVACTAGTCTAVGAAGTIITSTNGGATWSASTSGTSSALNAVACPSTTCYAVGGATGVSLILKTADGVSWTPETTNSAQPLSAVACWDGSNCVAGGTAGTVVTTNDGTNWTQVGDPLSGPTSALNATTSAIVGVDAAACSSVRCAFGTGSSGDIMTSPLLRVTVDETVPFGTAPSLSGLAPGAAAISYSPAGEAGDVTGSLTCSTTETTTSDPGSYPITGCSGLSDAGFTVVYDYANSAVTVVKASQTIAFSPPARKTFGDPDFNVTATASSGLPVMISYTSGPCTVTGTTSPVSVHITGAGPCVLTATQAGNIDYVAATPVAGTIVIGNSTHGTAIGSGLKDANADTTTFSVSANGGSPTGTLNYVGTPPGKSKPPTPPFHYDSASITAFGISADGTAVWFEGTGTDGSTFLVYAVDNGGPGTSLGSGRPADPDVFMLWINGVLVTPSSGALTGGRVVTSN